MWPSLWVRTRIYTTAVKIKVIRMQKSHLQVRFFDNMLLKMYKFN
jgi:hypothetical protein